MNMENIDEVIKDDAEALARIRARLEEIKEEMNGDCQNEDELLEEMEAMGSEMREIDMRTKEIRRINEEKRAAMDEERRKSQEIEDLKKRLADAEWKLEKANNDYFLRVAMLNMVYRIMRRKAEAGKPPLHRLHRATR